MLDQTYDNNKLVFRFSSTPTDFSIVVVQKQLTACSLRKSCSVRTANFWLTYLQQHEKKSIVNLHWNASLKFATFLGPFRVDFWRENASASRLAWRPASRTLDEPGRASAMRFASWTFFSSVKNRISRKSKGYPTCRLLNSPRVKSSLALYNLSKRIERPLLISPNDWNKLHSQGIRNLQRGIENPRLS